MSFQSHLRSDVLLTVHHSPVGTTAPVEDWDVAAALADGMCLAGIWSQQD